MSTAFAARIYRQYGNESIARMKENPFRLADDIWGIGFRTADGIAGKLGFGKETYVRLRSRFRRQALQFVCRSRLRIIKGRQVDRIFLPYQIA